LAKGLPQLAGDVVGNANGLICFLAKQFEPQFEPTDLLQMHNRHFIINMVIAGEKAPAFSATTLTLPPPQTDNTAKIIENTRRIYSRPRAEIEQEISAAIQPPAHLQKAPVSATQAKQWPIDASAQPVAMPVATEQGTEAPAKRKRTRTRRKKTPDSTDTSSEPSQVSNSPDSSSIHIER